MAEYKRYGQTRKKKKTNAFLAPLIFVLVLILLVFCVGMFFRVQDIEVVGAQSYTAEEIIEASGVEKGDNLFFINRFNGASNIFSRLPFVDFASIERRMPSTVVITVEEAKAAACLNWQGQSWMITAAGKLLGSADEASAASLIRVTGFEPVSPAVGEQARAAEGEELKLTYLKDLLAVLEADGYTVLTACDGEQALALMDTEHVDLVVLDVMMPNMDGYEFTRELRQSNSELPILMVSAKQLPADRKQGFLVGTDDYMTKPVDTEEMLLRIRALLRRARIVSERRIVIGDVTLDYDSFTVRRGGEVQELPQKEFLLLYKLLSYPGRIFTRIELMDEIWGADSDSGWETVTVHIGRLRRRFEGWSEFEIVSVRGLGYKAVKKA